jgi:WD40 repeat protein
LQTCFCPLCPAASTHVHERWHKHHQPTNPAPSITIIKSKSKHNSDRTILQRDVRAPAPFVATLAGHRSEVCGLRWSPDGRQLASGGNDNALLVWDAASATAASSAAAAAAGGGAGAQGPAPLLRFTEHIAAVKAIAWCVDNAGRRN